MTLLASITIRGYGVEAEVLSDPADPARGEWVEVWVSTPSGAFTNSLACLEGEGRFDDGPAISETTLALIADWALRHGY